MKFYEDNEMQILDDAYSTSCNLQLSKENINYEKLLMKNQSSVRISDHVKINNGENSAKRRISPIIRMPSSTILVCRFCGAIS